MKLLTESKKQKQKKLIETLFFPKIVCISCNVSLYIFLKDSLSAHILQGLFVWENCLCSIMVLDFYVVIVKFFPAKLKFNSMSIINPQQSY